MLRKMAWLGALGIAPTVLAQENGSTEAIPRPVMPRPIDGERVDRTETELKGALEELRREREQMRADRLSGKEARRSILESEPHANEEALRSRIAELLGRIKNTEPPTEVPSEGEPMKLDTDTATAVGNMTLGQSQFRAGEYEAALETLTRIPLTNLAERDRAWTQYLLAGCFRQRGETERAALLYRQVIEAKADEFLSESAEWHLQFLGWRNKVGSLETQSK